MRQGLGPIGRRHVPAQPRDAQAAGGGQRLRRQPGPRGEASHGGGEGRRDQAPRDVDPARGAEQPPVAHLADARGARPAGLGTGGGERVVVEDVEGHVRPVRLARPRLPHAAAGEEDVRPVAVVVALQALVQVGRLRGQVVPHEAGEDAQQGDVVEPREVGERAAGRDSPALDQHHRRAPRGDVVAEGARVPVLVVAPDPPRHEGLESAGDRRADALRPGAPRGQRALPVARHGQERDRGEDAGVAHGRAPVLVVQVEGELRLEAVAHGLEHAPLRRREVERVAVDVDGLRVAAGVALGAVGVEHRHHQERHALEDRPVLGLVRGEQRDGEVEEGRRRRRLVAVHLRPEEDAPRAAPEGHEVNGPALDGAAHLLEGEAAPVKHLERAQPLDELRVAQAGRGGRHEAPRRPGLPERPGGEAGCGPGQDEGGGGRDDQAEGPPRPRARPG